MKLRPMMPMGGMKGPGQMAPMGKNPQAAAMSNPAAQAPNPNRAALMQALMRPQANRQQRRPAPGPRPFIPGGLRRAGR